MARSAFSMCKIKQWKKGMQPFKQKHHAYRQDADVPDILVSW